MDNRASVSMPKGIIGLIIFDDVFDRPYFASSWPWTYCLFCAMARQRGHLTRQQIEALSAKVRAALSHQAAWCGLGSSPARRGPRCPAHPHRRDQRRINEKYASCTMRATCTDDTDHRTDGTQHAGIIWRPVHAEALSGYPVTVRNAAKATAYVRVDELGVTEPTALRTAAIRISLLFVKFGACPSAVSPGRLR